jgi:hypothetical protein
MDPKAKTRNVMIRNVMNWKGAIQKVTNLDAMNLHALTPDGARPVARMVLANRHVAADVVAAAVGSQRAQERAPTRCPQPKAPRNRSMVACWRKTSTQRLLLKPVPTARLHAPKKTASVADVAVADEVDGVEARIGPKARLAKGHLPANQSDRRKIPRTTICPRIASPWGETRTALTTCWTTMLKIATLKTVMSKAVTSMKTTMMWSMPVTHMTRELAKGTTTRMTTI